MQHKMLVCKGLLSDLTCLYSAGRRKTFNANSLHYTIQHRYNKVS